MSVRIVLEDSGSRWEALFEGDGLPALVQTGTPMVTIVAAGTDRHGPLIGVYSRDGESSIYRLQVESAPAI